MLYSHVPYHNDTIIKDTRNEKDAEDFFNKIFTSHFIAKGSKRLFKVCVCEGAGDRTETAIFWSPLLWPATLCLSCSSDAQPEAQGLTLLGAGFLYCILSATSLFPKLHLGSRGPRRLGVAFLTTLASPSPTVLELPLGLELNWVI